MTLLYILFTLFIISTILGTWYVAKDLQGWDSDRPSIGSYIGAFIVSGLLSFLVSVMIFMVVQAVGSALAQESKEVAHTHKLATLKDGTGVEGSMRGGLFVTRGYIADTQVFSYYRIVADNQYVLDKRNADKSTVWTDATNDTARVEITDKVYSCEDTWYLVDCQVSETEFLHADFHVPAGSIEQKYELDAQ